MKHLLLVVALALSVVEGVPARVSAGASASESDFLFAEHSFTTLNSPLSFTKEGTGEIGRAVAVPRPDTVESALADDDEAGIPDDLLAQGVRWNTVAQLARIPERASGPLKFTVLGDAEPGRFIWSRVLFGKKGVFEAQLRNIELNDSEFVLQLGDMVSRGIPKNYRHFYDDLNRSKFSKPYLSVIGNHDHRWPHGHSDADLYEGLFGPRNYSFDVSNARFVMLDTSQEELTDGQLAWLDKVLATDKKKFVFTHMPPVGFKGWTIGMTGIKRGDEEFLALMTKHKVDRVYLGHIHGYGIAQHGGVKYVLTGGGGSPLYLLPSSAPKLFYHYVNVAVDGERIVELVQPLRGPPFEILWPAGDKDFDLMLQGESGLVAKN